MSERERRSASGPGPTPFRIVAPLYFSDIESTGRLGVSATVVLAELDAQEAARIGAYHGRDVPKGVTHEPTHRIEMYLPAGASREAQRDRVLAVAGALAVATGALPLAYTLKAHRWDDNQRRWVGSDWLWWPESLSIGRRPIAIMYRGEAVGIMALGRGDMRWQVSSEAVGLWRSVQSLLDEASSGLWLPLEYFYLGLMDLMIDPRKTLFAWSVALESLLAGDERIQGIQVQQRAAHLLASGEGAARLFEEARTWGRARNNLVHAGRSPRPGPLAQLGQYLRAAIPAMASLISTCRSTRAALTLLDQAGFARDARLPTLWPVAPSWAPVRMTDIISPRLLPPPSAPP
jgi:hypothetical protein